MKSFGSRTSKQNKLKLKLKQKPFTNTKEKKEKEEEEKVKEEVKKQFDVFLASKYGEKERPNTFT